MLPQLLPRLLATRKFSFDAQIPGRAQIWGALGYARVDSEFARR